MEMNYVFIFFTLQALLGGFDTLYHHEITERLPWRKSSKLELKIHGIRGFFYALIFFSLGWVHWHGILALLFASIFVLEIILTLWDFVVEDQTRMLPATERITHTILAINGGVIMTLLFSQILEWYHLPTGFSLVYYFPWSWLMLFFAAGVLFWACRDFLRSRKQYKPDVLPTLNLQQKKLKFLLTGGTGFIGARLSQCLINAGHEVSVLTRDISKAASKFSGKVTLLDDLQQAGPHYNVIINLAGEPLAGGRWNKAFKQKAVASRIDMTKQLIDYIANCPVKPDLLINGSAIGFYGTSLEQKFVEDSQPSVKDFCHDLCQQWEQTAIQAEKYGVRVCCLRIGIVLGFDGGALASMLFPFEFCLGGKMGSGKQWMSWIHRDDLLTLIAFIINNENISGAVNAVAPEAVTNNEFSKTLAKVMHRPSILPIPALQLKLLFGEMADALLLQGQNVFPQKLQDSGFKFTYPSLKPALEEILG